MAFLFLIKKAIKGFWANRKINAFSVITTMFAMIILTSGILMFQNISNAFKRMVSNVPLTLFIKETATDNDIALLRSRLEKISGITNISYVSKEAAKKNFLLNPNNKLFIQEFSENPLPASLEITLAQNSEKLAEAVITISKESGIVDDYLLKSDIMKKAEEFLSWLEKIMMISGISVSFIILFIVSTTIRLSVDLRKDEIEIMELSGASASFIRTPFILEGIFQGAIGAFASLFVAYIGYVFFFSMFKGGLENFGIFLTPSFLGLRECLFLIFLGSLFGALGSALSFIKRIE